MWSSSFFGLQPQFYVFLFLTNHLFCFLDSTPEVYWSTLDPRLVVQVARTDTLSLSPLEIFQPKLGLRGKLSTGYNPEVAYEFVIQLLLIFSDFFGVDLVWTWFW